MFKGCKNLKKITIPDSIEDIFDTSFEGIEMSKVKVIASEDMKEKISDYYN